MLCHRLLPDHIDESLITQIPIYGPVCMHDDVSRLSASCSLRNGSVVQRKLCARPANHGDENEDPDLGPRAKRPCTGSVKFPNLQRDNSSNDSR